MVFLDENGIFYNKYYIPLSEKITLFDKSLSPEEFESYDELEEAALKWHLELMKKKNELNLKLPNLISSYYKRATPMLDDESEMKEDSGLDMTPRVNEMTPRDLTPRESQQLNPSEEENSQTSEILTNISNNFFKEEEIKWRNTLAPAEPDPNDYDSFEEYEQAMKNWFCLGSKIQLLPPHPCQIASLTKIVSSNEVKKKANFIKLRSESSQQEKDNNFSTYYEITNSTLTNVLSRFNFSSSVVNDDFDNFKNFLLSNLSDIFDQRVSIDKEVLNKTIATKKMSNIRQRIQLFSQQKVEEKKINKSIPDLEEKQNSAEIKIRIGEILQNYLSNHYQKKSQKEKEDKFSKYPIVLPKFKACLETDHFNNSIEKSESNLAIFNWKMEDLKRPYVYILDKSQQKALRNEKINFNACKEFGEKETLEDTNYNFVYKFPSMNIPLDFENIGESYYLTRINQKYREMVDLKRRDNWRIIHHPSLFKASSERYKQVKKKKTFYPKL